MSQRSLAMVVTLIICRGAWMLRALLFGAAGPLGSFTSDPNHQFYVRNTLAIEEGTTLTLATR